MNSLIPRAYRYSEIRIKVPVAKFHKESSNPGKGLGLEWRPSRLRSALKPRPGNSPEKEFPLQLTPSFYSLERTDTPPLHWESIHHRSGPEHFRAVFGTTAVDVGAAAELKPCKVADPGHDGDIPMIIRGVNRPGGG